MGTTEQFSVWQCDMFNFDDPRAAAERIRVATHSLISARDRAIVEQYLRELEDHARQKDEERLLRKAA